MIIIKSDEEIAAMRISCQLAASVRDRVASQIRPGATTGELDAYAAELIAAAGAKSAFLGYKGFPGNVCLSVNDEVVHGIPGNRRIEIGDIVSLDVGVHHGGFVGDTAVTIMVGVTDAEVMRLVDATQSALRAGIDNAVVNGRLGDISHAIEVVAQRAGFSIVREFVGHGVGRSMHEDPQVPNFGTAGKGPRLRHGMTLAIEPMVNLGVAEVQVMDDGWTVLTGDRKPSAHFEHTVAILDGGPEILTVSDVLAEESAAVSNFVVDERRDS
ncbi:MAG: type I methionyl aminopeptidase [Verrucomicrobia bacterium]|nr:type I methionyl aminopeptidase [Verrucomicrobiota bacterium]MDA1085726.1 type I methionyl aminopeptidase [Verrucomicrobiota bacterium]